MEEREDITEEVALHLMILEDASTKSTREEEARAATGAGVFKKARSTRSIIHERSAISGRESTNAATLRTLKVDKTVG